MRHLGKVDSVPPREQFPVNGCVGLRGLLEGEAGGVTNTFFREAGGKLGFFREAVQGVGDLFGVYGVDDEATVFEDLHQGARMRSDDGAPLSLSFERRPAETFQKGREKKGFGVFVEVIQFGVVDVRANVNAFLKTKE